MWRQSIRNHLARINKEHAASLCWDLRKFYESMSHKRLLTMADKYDFPRALVSLVARAYQMARVVTYDSQASGKLYPSRGIVAGDSMSDALVKLYYIHEFDRFVQDYPGIDLAVYYDDIQLSTRARPRTPSTPLCLPPAHSAA